MSDTLPKSLTETLADDVIAFVNRGGPRPIAMAILVAEIQRLRSEARQDETTKPTERPRPGPVFTETVQFTALHDGDRYSCNQPGNRSGYYVTLGDYRKRVDELEDDRRKFQALNHELTRTLAKTTAQRDALLAVCEEYLKWSDDQGSDERLLSIRSGMRSAVAHVQVEAKS